MPAASTSVRVPTQGAARSTASDPATPSEATVSPSAIGAPWRWETTATARAVPSARNVVRSSQAGVGISPCIDAPCS